MIGPAIPPTLLKKKQEKDNSGEIAISMSDEEDTITAPPTADMVGPQIPAHLLNRKQQKSSNNDSNEIKIPEEEENSTLMISDIGPQIPTHLLEQKTTTEKQQHVNNGDESNHAVDQVVGSESPPEASNSTSPLLPPATADKDDIDPDDFAPALPPELLEERRQRQQQQVEPSAAPSSGRRRAPIGPALPPGIVPIPSYSHNDDDDDIVGPILPSASEYNPEEASKLSAIRAIEERARQSKEAMETKEIDTNGKVERPEWMLVPPEVDYLKNANSGRSRGFTSGSSSTMSAAERDSSSWTETPAERERRLAEEQMTGVKRKAAVAGPSLPPSQLDIEKRKQVEQFNMQSRPMSLLEMHQQNRKKKRKSSKLTEEEDVTKRAFDRDKDLLAPRQMDTKQKKNFLKETAQMGRNFGYGSGGSFL